MTASATDAFLKSRTTMLDAIWSDVHSHLETAVAVAADAIDRSRALFEPVVRLNHLANQFFNEVRTVIEPVQLAYIAGLDQVASLLVDGANRRWATAIAGIPLRSDGSESFVYATPPALIDLPDNRIYQPGTGAVNSFGVIAVGMGVIGNDLTKVRMLIADHDAIRKRIEAGMDGLLRDMISLIDEYGTRMLETLSAGSGPQIDESRGLWIEHSTALGIAAQLCRELVKVT